MYYVYMLRCDDNSLYTGFTTDLNRRLAEHKAKNKPYGKYTRTHNALYIAAAWACDTRQEACRLEYYIKTLTKQKKETLINEPTYFEKAFGEKLDYTKYSPIKV